MQTLKHARLAALVIGAGLVIACGDRDKDNANTVDTAGGAVANAPVTSGAGTGSMEASNEPKNDAEIFALISQSNDAEVSSSELATKNASNAQVKAFARQMITDHSAMKKQGTALSKTLGVSPTDSTQEKQDAMNDQLDDLKGKKGADFDKAYMDMQVQAHQKTLSDLQGFQSKAQNADLKKMIEGAIPKVQAHLEKAQSIQQTVQNAKS